MLVARAYFLILMCLAEGFLSLSLVLIECLLIRLCSGEAVHSVALATLVEWARGGACTQRVLFFLLLSIKQ